MYKYYESETSYGRTVRRRRVEKYWFGSDALRIWAVMFLFISFISLAFILLKYGWVATVFIFGITIGLWLIDYFSTEHKYKNYIEALGQDPEQKTLKTIYDEQTEKLKNDLEELENTPVGNLTLSDIVLRDSIKRDLEQ